MKLKIKKGDKVKVIAGKHKGTVGEVIAAYPRKEKVLVDAVNVKKKAIKRDESSTENFVFVQHPIHVSNVKLVDANEVSKSEKSSKKSTKKKSISSKK